MQTGRTKLIRGSVRLLCGAAAGLIACTSSGEALAQHIVKPEVEKGQREIEAAVHGLHGLHKGAAGDVRLLNELSYQYGLTHFWLIKGILVSEQTVDGDWRAAAAVVENVFELQNVKAGGGIGLGWYTAVAGAIDDSATNSVVFGPIVRLGAGPTSLVLNPFFEQTFGRNREEGIAFSYGWNLSHELGQGFSVAVEGFGGLPDVTGQSGPEQHQIGPALAYDIPLGGQQTLGLEAGWLFGLSDSTAEHTIKFHIKYTY